LKLEGMCRAGCDKGLEANNRVVTERRVSPMRGVCPMMGVPGSVSSAGGGLRLESMKCG